MRNRILSRVESIIKTLASTFDRLTTLCGFASRLIVRNIPSVRLTQIPLRYTRNTWFVLLSWVAVACFFVL